MNTTLKSLAILTALSIPVAVAAQQEGDAGTGSGQMMQGGEGGMMGMMGMMSQMAPMMEACTEMMTAMTQQMEDGAAAEEQPKG